MNEHDSLVSHSLRDGDFKIQGAEMTNNPNDPLTAHNLKNFAAIAALNGIIAHEGAPAKDNLDYKSVVENDVARALDYADKLVELLSGNQAAARSSEQES